MLPLTGWSYCKKITVQTAYLDAALTSYSWGIFAIGDTGLGAKAMANGYDIRFTASDGITLLSHERRYFNIAAGAATGIWFVNTSLATSPATYIYIHYGNAAAPDVSDPVNAYDSSFKRVWALNEAYSTAAGNYKDRKGVGNLTLTDADGDSAQGTGPIDKAVDLNGDADSLAEPDHADHDPGGAFTIEVFSYTHNLPGAGNDSLLIGHYLSSVKYGLYASGIGTPVLFFRVVTASGTTNTATVAVSKVAWQYFAGTYDKTLGSNRLNLYVNGLLSKSANGYAEDVTAGDEGMVLGKRGTYFFDGLLAEVRYSNVARSAAWIKFTYYNITEADHEQTWGVEEDGSSIPVIMHHMGMMRRT